MKKGKFKIRKKDNEIETVEGWVLPKAGNIPIDLGFDKRFRANGINTYWVATELSTGLSIYNGARTRTVAKQFVSNRIEKIGIERTLQIISENLKLTELGVNNDN